MKEKLKLLRNWKWVFMILGAKVLWFYYLVKLDSGDLLVRLITFAFLAVLFDGFRRNAKKGKTTAFVVLYVLISIWMVADVMYYNYFIQYTSINQLFQINSLLATGEHLDMSAILSTTGCFLLLLDVPFVIYYFRKAAADVRVYKRKIYRFAPKLLVITAIVALPIVGFNPLNDDDIKSLDHLEFFSYHANDLVRYGKSLYARSNVDIKAIQNTIKENVPKSETSNYKGIAEGKNVIVIQMESFQNFPIGRYYHGEEITPNMNKLLQKDTVYVPNYYQSIGKGNTSDAEFATLNSFYPVTERESYRMYIDNNYNSLPWLLRAEGYSTFAFHGNTKTFWNREEAYKKEGIQQFYSKENLEMTEESGFGLTDKEMFKQAVAILQKEKKPFFSFMVTLTNHIPYELDDSLISLELQPEDDGTMFGHYLQSVRYADEAIGELMELLKENGMYDNTIIAMYGDHFGMSNEYPEVKASMEKFLGKTYDYDEMLNIPLLIHMPGLGVNETVETAGGQVDFLPTLANLMNLKVPQPYIFGKDLLNSTDGFVASVTYLLEGSFIKDDIMYQIGRDGTFESGRAWKISDGASVPLAGLEKYQKRASALVQTSKKVLDYNLMSSYPGQKYCKK